MNNFFNSVTAVSSVLHVYKDIYKITEIINNYYTFYIIIEQALFAVKLHDLKLLIYTHIKTLELLLFMKVEHRVLNKPLLI